MKKLIVALATVLTLASTSGSALAATRTTTTTTKPSYCGNTAYDVQYRAIYEYPTGSYWQNQIKAYPDYYAAHNAEYQAKYGC